MIIAVANQKGGPGKTTTSVNLAAALAEAGRASVSVVDLDAQRDAMSFAAGVPSVSFTHGGASTLPKTVAFARQENHDAILDCPPTLGAEVAKALLLSDLVIVPVNSEYSAMRGLQRLSDSLRAARRGGNPGLRFRVLLTMFDTRASHCHEMADEAARIFGGDVFQTRVRRTILFADAFAAGESILTFSRRSAAAASYRELAREVIALCP